jgi:hypothetical protein
MTALALPDGVTDVDSAGAREWLNIAKQQRVDGQRPVHCRACARGQSAGQEFPIVEQEDRRVPTRPSARLGERKMDKQDRGR